MREGVLKRCGFSIGWVIAAAGLAGCGSVATRFPQQLVNSDGQPILLDDVRDIVEDDGLSDDEKRGQIRDLGIEDEELIDALLTL